MGTHRRPPAEPANVHEEPSPAAGPAPRGGRTRAERKAERKAERLAKAERAVAEYARKDAERAARRAARRPEEAASRGTGRSTAPAAIAPAASAATAFLPGYDAAVPPGGGLRPGGPAQPAPAVSGAWFQDEAAPAGTGATGHKEKKKKKAKPVRAAEPRQPRPKDPRRRRRQVLVTTFSALGLAAAVGGGLAVANFAESAGGEESALPPVAVMSPAALKQLTSVPAAVLDKVGAGSAVALLGRVDAPPLRSGNKPRLLYIGAESCPLCAAERWSLVVALSRFGTWSNLGVILSPEDQLYPNTPTLSFHGATYTSKYLAFSGYETTSRVRTAGQYAPLDALSAADAATLRTLRAAPYVPDEATGRLPFLDLAGKFVGAGTHMRAPFIPYLADRTHDEIAASLADPNSALAKAIDGGANAITAAVCEVIPRKTRPADVCSSPAVRMGKSILRAKR